jgi:hypothetical protein
LLCDRIEIGRGNVSTHVESPGLHGLIIPEVLKSVRRHRGIAYGMLNVLVPQIVEESPDVLYAFYHVSCVS